MKDLKRHWVVHTRLKKFQCSYCHVLFGRNDHKIRHEKSAHLKSCQKSVGKTLVWKQNRVLEKEQVEERKKHILLPSPPKHLQRHNPQPHIAHSIPSSSILIHSNGMILYTFICYSFMFNTLLYYINSSI